MKDRPGSGKATIYDVAKAAGVSPKTAARILSGKKGRGVNKELVDKAAKRLGYVRNHRAASLRTGKTGLIGLILPSVTDSCYTWFYQELYDYALDRGYHILLSSVSGESSEIERAIQFMGVNHVEGLICNVGVWGNVKIGNALNEFMSQNLPVVLAGDRVEGVEADELVIENADGVRRVTEHLVKIGRRKIGFLSGSLNDRANRERMAGFKQALEAAGLALNPEWSSEGRSALNDGVDQAIEVLSRKERPDALVCAGDALALCAIRAAANLDLSVPGDVSITGFNDIEWAKLSVPSLTTLRQPQEIMARDAFELIMERIEKKDISNPRRLMYPPELIVRESS